MKYSDSKPQIPGPPLTWSWVSFIFLLSSTLRPILMLFSHILLGIPSGLFQPKFCMPPCLQYLNSCMFVWFEVIMLSLMKLSLFLDMVLCWLVICNLHFGGVCCLHLEGGQKGRLSSWAALNMEVAGSYETSVVSYQSVWHYVPKILDLQYLMLCGVITGILYFHLLL